MIRIRDSILMVAIVLPAACAQRSNDGAHDRPKGVADIVVTSVGVTSPITSGENAVFTIRVANAGPNDASNVKIIDTVGVHSQLVSMTCAAKGSAVCPDSPGISMLLPKLPNGGSLDFVITLKLADSDTGTIVNSLVANFDLDDDPNNNSVVVDALVR